MFAVVVLDPKRSQNIAIVLSQFSKLGFDGIRKAFLELDEDKIDIDGLDGISQYTPTSEEVRTSLPFSHNSTPSSENF